MAEKKTSSESRASSDKDKKAVSKAKGIRVPNRQAWVDTFVYLCPYHEGGTSCFDYCGMYEGKRTNCVGRCTYNGGGACTQVTQFFKTFIKFVNGELSFEHDGVLPKKK